jgi:ribose 5-phosphate isomerase B
MKIALGADHAGFKLKEKVSEFLVSLGHEVMDKGAFSFDPADDYPDFVFPVAHAVADGEADRGIIVGKSGEGEAMCANRVKGVRAALFLTVRST